MDFVWKILFFRRQIKREYVIATILQQIQLPFQGISFRFKPFDIFLKLFGLFLLLD